MFGKYGNYKAAVPDFAQEKFVLKDQLGKAQLMFIAKSNGGNRPKRKGMPRHNLTERKELHTQQLLDQALTEETSSENQS